MYPHPLTKNIYKQKEHPTLPFKGWIKPCINIDCQKYTSNFFIIDNNKYYCCKTCYKKFNMEEYVTQTC
jgi:hypothetical protein